MTAFPGHAAQLRSPATQPPWRSPATQAGSSRFLAGARSLAAGVHVGARSLVRRLHAGARSLASARWCRHDPSKARVDSPSCPGWSTPRRAVEPFRAGFDGPPSFVLPTPGRIGTRRHDSPPSGGVAAPSRCATAHAGQAPSTQAPAAQAPSAAPAGRHRPPLDRAAQAAHDQRRPPARPSHRPASSDPLGHAVLRGPATTPTHHRPGRPAHRVDGRARAGRPAADGAARHVAQRGLRAMDARAHVAGTAGHDLRPQRR